MLMEQSRAWLVRSREALLKVSVKKEQTGNKEDSEDEQWKREAIRRWGHR